MQEKMRQKAEERIKFLKLYSCSRFNHACLKGVSACAKASADREPPLRLREESNLHQRFRRPLLYPLSYEGKFIINKVRHLPAFGGSIELQVHVYTQIIEVWAAGESNAEPIP